MASFTTAHVLSSYETRFFLSGGRQRDVVIFPVGDCPGAVCPGVKDPGGHLSLSRVEDTFGIKANVGL